MMNYYIEVNLICVIILILFRIQLKNVDNTSADQRVLITIIRATLIFCFSDMVAGVVRGMDFPGARMIIELSNLLYFEMIAIVSFAWLIYVNFRLFKTNIISRKRLIIWAIPLIVFTIVAVSNPVTNLLFSIDANNFYKRNIGIYFHWVIIWGYFIVTSIMALRIYLKESSRFRRQEIFPLLYFMVAPFIASCIQMIFYGITSTQVGITISIAMICLKNQDSQILTDTLTGINNRRGMESYVINQIQHKNSGEYTLTMIDVNHFKEINDKYGHMTGDLVLKEIAEALKRACSMTSNRLHLCRFGGDEFVILGLDCEKTEIDLLKNTIHNEMKNESKEKKFPCEISVSLGSAVKKCTNEKDFEELMKAADEQMYNEKLENGKY